MQSSVQQSQPSVVPAKQKSVLQKHPPQDTTIKITAELTIAQNGPCIVLKGIQGMKLTNQQMQLIHQRVKQHLIKKGIQITLCFQKCLSN